MILVVTVPYTGTHWLLKLLDNIGVSWVHYHPGRISKHGGFTDGEIPAEFFERRAKALATWRPVEDQRSSCLRRNGKLIDGLGYAALREIMDRLDGHWVDLYRPDYAAFLNHLGLIPPTDLGHS